MSEYNRFIGNSNIYAATLVEPETEEEWVWVEGYKGTDKDMKCNNYQYELDKQFDMPEGEKIETCSSGFHFCRKLDSVFHYYSIGKGNRFFKVKALVRKDELDLRCMSFDDKLAAKSIVFEQELTADEILENTDAKNWSDEEKRMALDLGINKVMEARNAKVLMDLGFSKPLAFLLSKNEYIFEIAYAFGSQNDLSMDMKIYCIMSAIGDVSHSPSRRLR